MAFKKGVSGNSAGRPKGTTESTKLRKMIAKHGTEIIDVVVAQAKSGDMVAVKILLDRICPPLKSQSLPVKVPIGDGALSNQGSQILNLMSAGHLPVDDAASLLNALSSLGKLQEFDDLTKRIELLEQKK